MSQVSYGTITITDLLDTATYIYYSATGSTSNILEWHTAESPDYNADNDKYIGIYSGEPVSSGQPANPTSDILAALVISKYVGENGAKGDKGDQGVSIESVTPLYYASNSSTSPNKPSNHVTNTNTTSGSWTQAVPALNSTTKYLFTCDQVKYDSTSVGTNGYTWTTPVLHSALSTLTENYNRLTSDVDSLTSTYGTRDQNGNLIVESTITQTSNGIDFGVKNGQSFTTASLAADTTTIGTGTLKIKADSLLIDGTTFFTKNNGTLGSKTKQRVYYRTSSSTAPSAPATWITTDTNTYDGWSLKVTPIKAETVNNNQVIYNYLWYCDQTKTGDSTFDNSTVFREQSITVIDGGSIITNSISANKIAAGAITTDKIAANAVTAGKISVTDLSALNATIGGWYIGEDKLYIGTLGASNSIYLVPGGTTTNINGTSRSDLGLILGSNFGVTRSGNLYANSATLTNATISGSITMGSGSSINWSNVSQSGGTATLNSDFTTSGKTAYTVAQNASNAASDASSALSTANSASSTATTASNNVAKLANGTYSGGTFINGQTIISPIIIADSFYAQPETVSQYGSGHFILQAPKTVSGSSVTWQNVLDITYGFDSYRPYVWFKTNSNGNNSAYFRFSGGDVVFDGGAQLSQNQTFLNYGTIQNYGTIKIGDGKLVLDEYDQFFYSYSELTSYISSPVKGQIAFVLD